MRDKYNWVSRKPAKDKKRDENRQGRVGMAKNKKRKSNRHLILPVPLGRPFIDPSEKKRRVEKPCPP